MNAAASSPMPPADPQRGLELFATGTHAKGIIAVGTLAEGVVAIGVNAIGVVAIGLNAMGTLVGIGLNACGVVALSAVNSIGILAFSVVNAIGAFGDGWVNGLLHPVLGGLLVVLSLVLAAKLRQAGDWERPALPSLTPLAELQAGQTRAGWTKVRLLDVELDSLVVGDDDGEQAVRGPSPLLQQAAELHRAGRRELLLSIEVESAVDAAGADYRVAAESTIVLHAKAIRPVPRRPWWPQSPAELRRFVARSLWAAAPLGVALTFIATVLSW